MGRAVAAYTELDRVRHQETRDGLGKDRAVGGDR
jgi:hypothetical protein